MTVHRPWPASSARLPGSRPELTQPELERVLPELGAIGDTVQAEIAAKVI